MLLFLLVSVLSSELYTISDDTRCCNRYVRDNLMGQIKHYIKSKNMKEPVYVDCSRRHDTCKCWIDEPCKECPSKVGNLTPFCFYNEDGSSQWGYECVRKSCCHGKHFNMSTCRCECDNTCPDDYVLDQNTCQCECNKICPEGRILNQTSCECICNTTCEPGYKVNPDTCQCECSMTDYNCPTNYGINDDCDCECILGAHYIVDGYYYYREGEIICQDARVEDCKCKCLNDRLEPLFVISNSNERFECVCGDPPECSQYQHVPIGSCSCQCPGACSIGFSGDCQCSCGEYELTESVIYRESTCTYECNKAYLDCEFGQEYHLEGNVCTCEPVTNLLGTCPQIYTNGPELGECQCFNPECEEGKTKDSNCECICIGPYDCEVGETYNHNTCQCVQGEDPCVNNPNNCDLNIEYLEMDQDCNCICTNDCDQYHHPELINGECQCICNYDPTLGINMYLDQTDCSRRCISDECPNGAFMDQLTCMCTCNQSLCQPGFYSRPVGPGDSCICQFDRPLICPSNFVIEDDRCVPSEFGCPNNLTPNLDLGLCQCDIDCPNGHINYTLCQCITGLCQYNYTFIDGECRCLAEPYDGFVVNQETCTYECLKTCPNIDEDTCMCICEPCPGNLTLNQDTCACECLITDDDCPENHIVCDQCTCMCNLKCPCYTELNLKTCHCDCRIEKCRTNFTLDSELCRCICPYNYTFDGYNCYCGIDQCPGDAIFNQELCTCECQIHDCPEGYIFSETLCQCLIDLDDCRCPTHQIMNQNGECQCNIFPSDWDSDGTRCLGTFDHENCQCLCDEGMNLIAMSNALVCVCQDESTCENNQYYDNKSCQCKCAGSCIKSGGFDDECRCECNLNPNTAGQNVYIDQERCLYGCYRSQLDVIGPHTSIDITETNGIYSCDVINTSINLFPLYEFSGDYDHYICQQQCLESEVHVEDCQCECKRPYTCEEHKYFNGGTCSCQCAVTQPECTSSCQNYVQNYELFNQVDVTSYDCVFNSESCICTVSLEYEGGSHTSTCNFPNNYPTYSGSDGCISVIGSNFCESNPNQCNLDNSNIGFDIDCNCICINECPDYQHAELVNGECQCVCNYIPNELPNNSYFNNDTCQTLCLNTECDVNNGFYFDNNLCVCLCDVYQCNGYAVNEIDGVCQCEIPENPLQCFPGFENIDQICVEQEIECEEGLTPVVIDGVKVCVCEIKGCTAGHFDYFFDFDEYECSCCCDFPRCLVNSTCDCCELSQDLCNPNFFNSELCQCVQIINKGSIPGGSAVYKPDQQTYEITCDTGIENPVEGRCDQCLCPNTCPGNKVHGKDCECVCPKPVDKYVCVNSTFNYDTCQCECSTTQQQCQSSCVDVSTFIQQNGGTINSINADFENCYCYCSIVYSIGGSVIIYDQQCQSSLPIQAGFVEGILQGTCTDTPIDCRDGGEGFCTIQTIDISEYVGYTDNCSCACTNQCPEFKHAEIVQGVCDCVCNCVPQYNEALYTFNDITCQLECLGDVICDQPNQYIDYDTCTCGCIKYGWCSNGEIQVKDGENCVCVVPTECDLPFVLTNGGCYLP